jgi:hypothetical protein
MPSNKLRKTAWDRFYKDRKKIKQDLSAKPWTLLLGSGMHKAIFTDRENTPRQEQALAVLGSWDGFLKEVFHSSEIYAHFKDSPSLQWEMYAIKGESQRLKNKMAYEKEGQLHETVQSMLADSQKILYSDTIHSRGYKSISRLIASSEISDIVSLNLDLGIEKILKGLNFKKDKHRVNCSPESSAKIGRHTHFIHPSNGENEIKKCI